MPSPSIMMGQSLPRTLKTALSDVVGASGLCDFEYREVGQPPKAIGIVTSSGTRNLSPLFGGDGIRPDLHALPFREVHFWVRVVCIYSKVPVVRQVKTVELFAIWDYKGKLESQQWSCIEQLVILWGRVACLPGKMLWQFTQFICNACLTRLTSRSQTLGSDSSVPMAGLTRDIPFSPMEVKASTRVGAAQADDAEVDLSAWALPKETIKQVNARKVLWRFAVRWWAWNIAKEAFTWWQANGKDLKDLAAIQNCIYRA